MRIGFFGGSFDPPHIGHLAVAEAAIKAFDLQRVLLAPVGRQPLKKAGAHASFADRLQMVDLLCQTATGLLASDLDAPRGEGALNFTVDALRTLHQRQPDAEVFGIVGLDAFVSFPHWREPDELFRLAEWIVVSRPGSSFQDVETLRLSAEQTARIHRLPTVHVPVSATRLRARLASGESCADAIPKPVLDYIRQHRLYGTVQ